jgi:hypothetical protein
MCVYNRMYFLIDNDKRIIFGWSAKCGCSHVKCMFIFLTKGINDFKNIDVHTGTMNKLPDDITDYKIILITRNPYKMIISGFIEKYSVGGSLYDRRNEIISNDSFTFAKFINALIDDKYFIKINKHHFTKQLSENFDDRLKKHNFVVVYDIENIDYNFIEKLYEKKIPINLIKNKFSKTLKSKNKLNKFIYDLEPEEYKMFEVDIKYFYNEELKDKIYNYFIDDFLFFESKGFDYDFNLC